MLLTLFLILLRIDTAFTDLRHGRLVYRTNGNKNQRDIYVYSIFRYMHVSSWTIVTIENDF
jgi:hypothetical protein